MDQNLESINNWTVESTLNALFLISVVMKTLSIDLMNSTFYICVLKISPPSSINSNLKNQINVKRHHESETKRHYQSETKRQ